MTTNTITRQSANSIEIAKKWKIIEDYLACKLSNNDIAEKYQISVRTVETVVQDTYQKFQNVRETKTLLATQKRPDFFLQLKRDYIDSERVNQEFLSSLSEPDSLVLTDKEMIFCELFVNNGDELSAIEESGLQVGLNKKDGTSYKDALKLRAFYLRRKPNIAVYLNDARKRSLSVLSNSKEHLQAELLALVEKLRNNGDPRSVPSILKAIELLGKSEGMFEEKINIEHTSGDDALDRILQKARKADVIEIQ